VLHTAHASPKAHTPYSVLTLLLFALHLLPSKPQATPFSPSAAQFVPKQPKGEEGQKKKY